LRGSRGAEVWSGRLGASDVWLWGTVSVTVASVAAGWFLAPVRSGLPSVGLGWLLFVGSSVHVASTTWLCSASDMRAEMWARRKRYVWGPLGLTSGASLIALVVPARTMVWLLLPYFGWQFSHFQRQNLGLTALAALSHGVGSPRSLERRALAATGWAGTIGLLLHPQLLQLAVSPGLGRLFPVAIVGFAAGAVAGVAALGSRPATQRPAGFCVVYLLSQLFWLPVFVFRSPYAAVGGLTIAHGLQYLLLIGVVATGDRRGHGRATAAGIMLALALVIGAALSAASHLHSSGLSLRWLFGIYLGLVMSHFVVDAGAWRLRDSFPRRFLISRVPFLLPGLLPESTNVAASATDRSVADHVQNVALTGSCDAHGVAPPLVG
jgi:hypothetical protein